MRIVLRPPLRQRLRGEDVLDLARADAEGERAEGAVRGGVRVAADDRHPRLGQAELGADHVDDAVAAVAERIQAHAELGAVARERLELGLARARPARRGRWRRCGRRSRRCGRAGAPRRPAARSPSNACGLVTSCTRCRSTKSRSSPIRWSSQTFSNRVRGAARHGRTVYRAAIRNRLAAVPYTRRRDLRRLWNGKCCQQAVLPQLRRIARRGLPGLRLGGDPGRPLLRRVRHAPRRRRGRRAGRSGRRPRPCRRHGRAGHRAAPGHRALRRPGRVHRRCRRRATPSRCGRCSRATSTCAGG